MTITELFTKKDPQLVNLLSQLLIAVNTEYASNHNHKVG